MKKIFSIAALALALVACERHDFFDENTITGKVGPEAYWEVESFVVKAGTSMNFDAQYYSSVSEIDHSEVWYNVVERVETKVDCPWLATFSMTKTFSGAEEKRVLQKIQEYTHTESLWSDSLHAYHMTTSFPVSGTLAPYAWDNPVEFDSAKMEQYFGPTFMAEYKQALAEKMKYADYRKMYLGLGLVDDFRQFTDSTEDKNQGEGVYVYHFPKNGEGQEVVPAEVQTIWDGITFEQLVTNTAESNHTVSYKRSYSIEAQLRVYDIRGVYGRTEGKEITIN